jgi:hypothetical protein
VASYGVQVFFKALCRRRRGEQRNARNMTYCLFPRNLKRNQPPLEHLMLAVGSFKGGQGHLKSISLLSFTYDLDKV